jgi:hypothetical protein
MRTVLRSYEPVFGGIVAILATAFLCLVLAANSGRVSDSSTAHLVGYCGAAIAWGLLQIAGYRGAKRRHIALAEPVLDASLGCILLGLILGLVTVCLYEFAQNTSYAGATGLMTVILLGVGAVVGIRKGTWK